MRKGFTKKIGAVVLSIAMICTMAACGKKEEATTTEEIWLDITAEQEEEEVVEETTEATTEEIVEEPVVVEPFEPFLLYISGHDTWGHISVQSRSDVNILAAINPNTKQIMLVNTPRDYFVPLSVSNGAQDKLTHAGLYGIDVSVASMEMLYGVDVDCYFMTNFSGFEGLINSAGGINVFSEFEFTVDPIKHYLQGENFLTGLESLAFVRERHAFAAGDNQRGKNQMSMLEAIVNKLCNEGALEDYERIFEENEGTFQTDLTDEQIANMVAYQLQEKIEWNIQKYSVTGIDSSGCPYSLGGASAYVMLPKQDEVAHGAELLNKVLNGEIVDMSAE